MVFQIPYGHGALSGELPDARLTGVFESRINAQRPSESGETMLRKALENPIGSARVEALAASANSAVIIASDHTRPVPSKLIFPQLLRRLRAGKPGIDIRILIATGCHRPSTKAELIGKFGEEIVASEKIFIHDCRDEAEMVSLGKLPSGAELKINRMALECELLLSEGFIEPHFFAGFSGGRKSVLPGISSEKTVMGNHCSRFIANPNSRAGVLNGNPLHKDMLYAAEKAGLKFIVNVVINGNRELIRAVAGNPFEAHRAGCEFLEKLCRVSVPESEIVIVGNGGYPLDQNIYQAVKGMSAGEAVCAPGGVIIMVAECSDSHGGESFYRMLSEARSPVELLSRIEKIPQDETLADQWEAQILARILSRFTVIMVTDKCPAPIIESMHMKHAGSLKEAIAMAFESRGASAKVAVIPDGVSLIAEKMNTKDSL